MKINLSECFITNEEIRSVSKVIKSGWLATGKITKKFEDACKKKIGCKEAIATNSCTNGINAVLHALKLKPGDEVITSPLTYISTINNLYNFGLKIKFIDINKNNYCIDLDLLKKAINKKTKCILITHYGGVPCDTEEVLKIINKKKIFLIEDAATAFGSKIKEKYIGSFNNSCAVFSFYPNKIITTGEGGLICTNNITLAKKLRNIIYCGINKTAFNRSKKLLAYKYDVTYPGFKYNFTDIQAALGISQLKKLDKLISYRLKLRKIYYKYLNDLKSNKIIQFQEINNKFKSSEYIFTILLNKNKLKCSRDKLLLYLSKKNISCSVHYMTTYNLSFYKNKFNHKKLTFNKEVCENILSLPFHNNLKENDVRYICKEINYFLNINKK